MAFDGWLGENGKDRRRRGRGIASWFTGRPECDIGEGMKWERVQSSEQIACVARLARETWTEHYVPIIGAAQVEYMLEKFQSEAAIALQMAAEGYEYYLVPDAGYLALVPDRANKRVLLSKIYVKSAQRGTGLGRALVEFAAARCGELGCHELWLTVNRNNTGSIAFYERMGFRKTNEMVTDIGNGFVMDDWRMAKTILAIPDRPSAWLDGM